MTLFANPYAASAIALVIGLCVGSFLNVVIHRLPRMMERDWEAQCAELAQSKGAGSGMQGAAAAPSASAPGTPSDAYNLFVPRSRCPACGHGIGAAENIPLVSYALLRGRCSACRARI